LATLIAGTSSIYSRDFGATLKIQYLKVWGGASPYDQGTKSLDSFTSAYQSVSGNKKADVAHLFTGIREGGVAYVGTVCGSGRRPNTGVSSLRGNWRVDVDGNGNQKPSQYNWDLIVTSHELGHNMGSSHTFSGYTPPIDQCIKNGRQVARGSADCVRGTIMSYCHLCGGISNVDMKFHPRVITKITDNLKKGMCKLDLART
jgi:hypothetical protein